MSGAPASFLIMAHSALLVTIKTPEDLGAGWVAREERVEAGASGRATQSSYQHLVLLGFLQIASPRGLAHMHGQFQI